MWLALLFIFFFSFYFFESTIKKEEVEEEIKEEDEKRELKTIEEEEEKEEEKYCIFEKKKEEKKCRVFAKFKNYNKGNSMQSTKTSPLKQHKVQPINMKNIPIKARTNRYTYEGKLMNFSFLQKVNKKDNISYSDFKKTLIK